jgi:hypothetical protein
MPIRLDTVLKKVERMPNIVSSDLLKDFYQHMKDNGTSQNYQKGNLKAIVHFVDHIGPQRLFTIPIGKNKAHDSIIHVKDIFWNKICFCS